MSELRLTLTTDLSETYTSVWSDATPEQIDQFRAVLGKFSKLESMNITTEEGEMMYFNPQHLVSATLETR